MPTWEEVRALMLAPKPALTATAYAIAKDPAVVAHDGRGTWTIDGAEPPSDAGWVLSAVEPSRLARLPEAQGTVTGWDRSTGRDGIAVSVTGLRGSKPLHLIVDAGTGVILRSERADDPAPLVVLMDLEVLEGF
jgi:hypothetical protein